MISPIAGPPSSHFASSTHPSLVFSLHKMTIAQQAELTKTNNNVEMEPSAKTPLDHVIQATPYVDIVVPHSNLFEGATEVVLTLFPQWTKEELDFLQCKDGITNKLVRVTHSPTNFKVLVRAYGKGSEQIIDRRQEIINILTVSAQGLCPPLYGRFRNGLVYGYIDGSIYSVDEMRDPHKAALVAKKLARWHQVTLQGDEVGSNGDTRKITKLWSTMWKWIDQVPTSYDSAKIQDIFEKNFDVSILKEELEYLQTELSSLDAPIVFAHNDLLYGNIIYNEEKDEASFIDYEYGCYGYRGFDIGNHFNEFAGFECDYSKYPEKSFQYKWLDDYLRASSLDHTPTTTDLDTLHNEVEHFSLASHFYWGLWAMVQASLSDIDFDYMSYAVLRFSEYEKRKREVMHDRGGCNVILADSEKNRSD